MLLDVPVSISMCEQPKESQWKIKKDSLTITHSHTHNTHEEYSHENDNHCCQDKYNDSHART